MFWTVTLTFDKFGVKAHLGALVTFCDKALVYWFFSMKPVQVYPKTVLVLFYKLNMLKIIKKLLKKSTYICLTFIYITIVSLTHLSTKWSWWAIVVSGCRCLSSIVRQHLMFTLWLETTFVIRFLWNLVRMFVLTISRPSSNMGHSGVKTRSPGQILGNFCIHSRGHICDPILMKLRQNVCFYKI